MVLCHMGYFGFSFGNTLFRIVYNQNALVADFMDSSNGSLPWNVCFH